MKTKTIITTDDRVRLLDKKFDKFDKRFGDLEEKMLNWKSDIVDAVEVLTKEIRDQRDFREITTNQITEVTERVDNLEKKVFGKVCAA
jgi:hypothetical protein